MTMHAIRLGVLGLTAALGLTGCRGAAPRDTTPTRDGVFIHIGSGFQDPHAVLMGLRMATLMSADRDVLVYFDLKGAEIVLKDASDIEMTPFESSQTQLRELIRRQVPLYVCPGCLKAAGKTPNDVMAGVKIAEKEAFFNFTKGRILTLDY